MNELEAALAASRERRAANAMAAVARGVVAPMPTKRTRQAVATPSVPKTGSRRPRQRIEVTAPKTVRRKKVPVANDGQVNPKVYGSWSLDVIEDKPRVVFPQWSCGCRKVFDITPATLSIECFKCGKSKEVRESRLGGEGG